MVLLKGSGFSDISKHFLIMTIYSTVVTAYAVFRYKKVK